MKVDLIVVLQRNQRRAFDENMAGPPVCRAPNSKSLGTIDDHGTYICARIGINAAIFMLTYALVLENLLVPHPAVAALMVVALTACYIPARRASRVIPMIGLR